MSAIVTSQPFHDRSSARGSIMDGVLAQTHEIVAWCARYA
jgi:hypothetical protein